MMKRLNEERRERPCIQSWKYLVGFLLMFAFVTGLAAQEKEKKVTMKCVNEKLTDALKRVEKQSSYKIVFSYNELHSIRVNASIQELTAPEAVKKLIAGQPVKSSVDGRYIHVFLKKDKKEALEKGLLRGQVVDENDEPLPGVSVRVKNGRSTGTLTDLNGCFSIPVKEGQSAMLTFSFIGKKTVEKMVNDGWGVQVKLEEMVNAVDEVVVTGYQVMDKRLMASATSTVKMDDIKIPTINSVDKMLQGTIPGLMVQNSSGSPNATPRIRMRGSSTIYGNASPLWVVDGIVYEDPIDLSNDELNNVLMGSDMLDQVNQNATRSLLGNAIAGVNPNDIESITFLKDASATAIYGTRAANGVIVLTTKKGKIGKPAISFSASLGFTGRPRYSQYNLMNSKERVGISREVAEKGYLYDYMPYATGFEGALFDFYNMKITKSEFDEQVAKYETMNTDWFKLLCRNAFNQDYSASISGGNEKVNYYTSIGYNNSKGTTKGDNSTSYSLTSNISAYLTKKVRAYTRLSFSEQKSDGFYTTNPYTYALQTTRAIGPDEYYTTQINTIDGLSNNYLLTYNIFNELAHTGNEAKSRNFSGNVGIDVKIWKGLTLQTLFGLRYVNSTNYQWADERSYYIAGIRGYDYGTVIPNGEEEKKSKLPHGGILNYNSVNNVGYTARAQLSYATTFGEMQQHAINGMIGYEATSNQYDGFNDVEYGYYPDRGMAVSYEYDKESAGSSVLNNSSLEKHTVSRKNTKNNAVSAYATLVYALKNRYIFNANLRGDASNRFGQYTNHKFLPVWSLAARWKINDESWFRDWKALDDFSIRFSYGQQGNIPTSVGPNLVAQYMALAVNRFSGNYQLGIKRLPYPDLRWEKTVTTNYGLDFSLLNGRISGTVDYYVRKGKDLIFSLPVASEYGTTQTFRNGASMKNYGIEVGLTFIPVQTRDFTWTLTPIYSKNTNNISNTTKQDYTYLDYLAGNAFENGKPVNALYAWEFKGLDHETGRAMFEHCSTNESEVEKSNDPKSYLKYCGSTDPKFNGGLSTSLRYKNFILNAQFAYAFGHVKRLNFLFSGTMKMPTPQTNLTTDFLHCWREPGDEEHTDIPGIAFGEAQNYYVYTPIANATQQNTYDMYNYSDVRVVKADFFRCRNLMLTYTLPDKWLQPLNIAGMSCSFNVTNLFTLCSSRFNGQDPEVASTGSVALPITRTYSFSVSLNF